MGKLTDETLMAFVDGELDAAEQERVRQALAEDGQAVERLAIFEATGKNLALLYDRPMREAVPSHLIELVKGVPPTIEPAFAKREGRRWLSWKKDRGVSWGFGTFAWGLAAAGAGAILLGVLAYDPIWTTKQNAPDDQTAEATVRDDVQLAGDWLRKVLDTAPSGKAALAAASTEANNVLPVLTFKAGDGRFCRQYEFDGTQGRVLGLACRQTNGDWQVLKQFGVAAKGAGAEGYSTASGSNRTAIDDVVDNLIEGDVLGSDDEADLIESDWR